MQTLAIPGQDLRDSGSSNISPRRIPSS